MKHNSLGCNINLVGHTAMPELDFCYGPCVNSLEHLSYLDASKSSQVWIGLCACLICPNTYVPEGDHLLWRWAIPPQICAWSLCWNGLPNTKSSSLVTEMSDASRRWSLKCEIILWAKADPGWQRLKFGTLVGQVQADEGSHLIGVLNNERPTVKGYPFG